MGWDQLTYEILFSVKSKKKSKHQFKDPLNLKIQKGKWIIISRSLCFHSVPFTIDDRFSEINLSRRHCRIRATVINF